MNEKVKKLLTPQLLEWGGDSGDNFSEELEKFAESIVRECTRICTQENPDPRDSVELQCANRILKHFDVLDENPVSDNWVAGEISAAQNAIDCIAENAGIRLTENEFLGLVEGYDPELLDELEQWGIDTLTRDILMDLIAYNLLSKYWPRYKDGVDIDSFMQELHAAAKTAGYEVESA